MCVDVSGCGGLSAGSLQKPLHGLCAVDALMPEVRGKEIRRRLNCRILRKHRSWSAVSPFPIQRQCGQEGSGSLEPAGQAWGIRKSRYEANMAIPGFEPVGVSRVPRGRSRVSWRLGRVWTLSAWKNEDALRAFVQSPPHVPVMTALAPHMDKTQFVQCMVKGVQLPLQWDHALRRFGNSPL